MLQGSISSLRFQRGQAMAEFVVVATFFIVPLLLCMTYLARVEDSRFRIHESARYAAWERTVWYRSGSDYVIKNDADLAHEISNRILVPGNRAMDTQVDRQAISSNSYKLDPFLYTDSGGTKPMLKRVGNQQALAQVGYSEAAQNNVIAQATNLVASKGLKIPSSGIATSTVSVELEKIPLLTSMLPANFTSNAQNAILGGAWNARGPDNVKSRVKGTVLTGYVNSIPMFTALQSVIGVLFPEIAPNSLIFGHIDPDRVPCQRLAGSTTNC